MRTLSEQTERPVFVRKSGVELLRIVLMVMVVTLHYNGGNGHAMEFSLKCSGTWFYTHILEALCVCAVDCFILISGYFLAYNRKIQLKKLLSIILTVMLIYEIGYFVRCIFGEQGFSFFTAVRSAFPNNYYAFLYLTTYILSPFVNLIFDRLKTKKLCGVFIAVLLGLFVVYPTVMDMFWTLVKHFNEDIDLGGISTISAQGNLGGYSVVNFVTIYCLGVYTRRFNLKLGMAKSMICYGVTSGLIFAAGISAGGIAYSYCSVPCVASAWFLFMIFNQLEFRSKIVNYISKSTFGVFCLHGRLAFLFFPSAKIQNAYETGRYVDVFVNSFVCVGTMVFVCYAAVTFLLFVCTPPRRFLYNTRLAKLEWEVLEDE